jgi:hypothetical protein
MLRRYLAAIVPILTLALFAPLALASTSLTGTYRTEVTTPASLKGTWSFKFAHGRDSQSLNGKEIAHGTYTISGATIKFANAAMSHPEFHGDFYARFRLAEGEVPGYAKSEEVSPGAAGPRDAAGVRVRTPSRRGRA